jgi:hypothetical protein
MNRLYMAVFISEALLQLLCGIDSALVLSVAAIGGTSPACDAIRCGAEVETRGRPRCCCGAHSELNIGSPMGGYPNLLDFYFYFSKKPRRTRQNARDHLAAFYLILSGVVARSWRCSVELLRMRPG